MAEVTTRRRYQSAQDIIYGTGGWTGPVVTTSLTMGPNGQSVSSDTYLALTDEQEPGNFGKADGIRGVVKVAVISRKRRRSH